MNLQKTKLIYAKITELGHFMFEMTIQLPLSFRL